MFSQTHNNINKIGDVVANLYTEAVIVDIKSKMNFSYPVSVYGGNTFSEWHYLNEQNALEYPNVLIQNIIEFTDDYKEYETFTSDGNVIKRPFSVEILPITFQIKMEVHAKERTQCKEVTNLLKQWYATPQTISIASPMHNGEKIHIQIHYDQRVSEFKGRDFSENNDTFISSLWFHRTLCIYYDDEQNKNNIFNNRLLQINLLKQALFCGECSKLLKSTSPGNYYDFARGKKLLFGFLFSEEFKMLKYNYDNGLPLDKDMFNRVFNHVVKVYPYLYDKAVQRWSYQQVQSDIARYAELFNKKHIEICTLLDIHFEHKYLPPAYALDNLNECIELMKNDPTLSLKEAIATIEEELLDARMNVEIDTSNSGGGLLSGLAHQAIESHNIKKHAGDITKRDLIGLSGCAKTQGGTCSTCNLRFSCSRYF